MPAAETTTPGELFPTPNPFDQPALPLLTTPTNNVTKRVFVAATRMNDGKTTTCLGLYGALQARFPRVGFIKPVGQRFVEVHGQKIDEDSVLLDSIFQVRVPIESMSPVAIDSTFTRRFLENPEVLLPALEDRICRAFDRVSWEKISPSSRAPATPESAPFSTCPTPASPSCSTPKSSSSPPAASAGPWTNSP